MQLEAIDNYVSGKPQPLEKLSEVSDTALISKVSFAASMHANATQHGPLCQLMHLLLQYYKVSPGELKVGTVTDAALFRIAARDC